MVSTELDVVNAAESGRTGFETHAQEMTTLCQTAAQVVTSDAAKIDNAINSARATVQNMSTEEWGGVPIDAYHNAVAALHEAQLQLAGVSEAFSRASGQFANALSALESTRSMAEQHRAAQSNGIQPGTHQSLIH